MLSLDMRSTCTSSQKKWAPKIALNHTLSTLYLCTERINYFAMNSPLRDAVLTTIRLQKDYDHLQKLLSQKGVNLNRKDAQGDTYLHDAIRENNVFAVEALLQAGADPLHRRGRARNESTEPNAFHFAASLERSEILEDMIYHCKEKKLDMQLEECGLDPVYKDLIAPPLLLAARNEHADSAVALMRAGANVNATDASGRNILHYFCHIPDSNRHPKFVKVIKVALQLGADVSAGASLDRGRTRRTQPIHVAAMFGFTKAIVLLLKHGASIDARDGFGRTPLHLTISGIEMDKPWSPEASLVLVSAGADVLAEDGDGNTMLQGLNVCTKELQSRGAAWDGSSTMSTQLQNIADVVVALFNAGDHSWDLVPEGCPGMERSLLSIWRNSKNELSQVFQRLGEAVQKQIQTALLCLHRYLSGPGEEHIRITIVAAMFD